MPKKDGFAVLREIRADSDLAELPVILCLAPCMGSIVAGDLSGPTGLLIKPGAFYELLDVMKTIAAFWRRVTSEEPDRTR